MKDVNIESSSSFSLTLFFKKKKCRIEIYYIQLKGCSSPEELVLSFWPLGFQVQTVPIQATEMLPCFSKLLEKSNTNFSNKLLTLWLGKEE